MGLVNLEGKEKLFLLLNVLLNHRAEQCCRNLTQELCEGCLRVVPSPVKSAVRGCSAPPCLSFPLNVVSMWALSRGCAREPGTRQGWHRGVPRPHGFLVPPPSPSPWHGVTAAVVAFVVTQKKL